MANQVEVVSRAKYVRTSPRKTGLVLALVRSQSVQEARRRLKFSGKRASKLALKVLDSATANAKQQGLDESSLVVSSATAGPGPTLKRWRPMARGQTGRIRKRSCHITIKLKAQSEKRKTKA